MEQKTDRDLVVELAKAADAEAVAYERSGDRAAYRDAATHRARIENELLERLRVTAGAG